MQADRIHKKLFFLTLIFILLFYFPSYAASSGEPEINVVYFYNNPCSACNEEAKFYEKFNELAGDEKDGVKVNIRTINVFRTSGESLLQEYYDRYKIPKEKRILPALFINDRLLAGSGDIERLLGDEFINEKKRVLINNPAENKAGDSKIIYFHVSSCSECESVNKFIDTLNNTYQVEYNGTAVTSKLSVVKLNIGDLDNLQLIKKYFKKYNVPESDQKVPIIFMKDVYMPGESSIKQNLVKEIQKGKGIGVTELSNDGQKPDDAAYTLSGYELSGVFLTGLINGLNPCSISMLLFFISVLLVKNVRVIRFGLSFIAGKFTAYFLLGTLLFGLIISFEGGWFKFLQNIVKIVLVILTLSLAALNIQDYFAAKNEKYNKIKLQLPVSLRKFNHRWINKISEVNSTGFLLFISFVLGAFISAGEFLCTGQIYLASIIYILKKSPVLNAQTIIYFLIYGLALIIPLTVLTLAVHKGKEIFEVSEVIRKNMHIIKLVNAAVFLLFGIIALLMF